MQLLNSVALRAFHTLWLRNYALSIPLLGYGVNAPKRGHRALRALDARRLLASDSLPCWRKPRGKTPVRHRFRGLLPFCLCRRASRQKGRRDEIGSPSWFCPVAHHAAHPPRVSRAPLEFTSLLACESQGTIASFLRRFLFERRSRQALAIRQSVNPPICQSPNPSIKQFPVRT